jgi:DNA-directed RNA polymerase alpha subunit
MEVKMAKKLVVNPFVSFLNDLFGLQIEQEISEAICLTIDTALLQFTDREQAVLRSAYGIGQPKRTLSDIGKELGCSREQVRQINAKALRKLKHPSRSILIKNALMEDGILEPTEPLSVSSSQEPRQMGLVEGLEISVRTANVLRDAGVATLVQLRALTEEQILALPNAGRKMLNEIREILAITPLILQVKLGSIVKEMGITNLGQLCQMTEADLRLSNKVSEGEIAEIKEVLKEHGLCLGMRKS